MAEYLCHSNREPMVMNKRYPLQMKISFLLLPSFFRSRALPLRASFRAAADRADFFEPGDPALARWFRARGARHGSRQGYPDPYLQGSCCPGLGDLDAWLKLEHFAK